MPARTFVPWRNPPLLYVPLSGSEQLLKPAAVSEPQVTIIVSPAATAFGSVTAFEVTEVVAFPATDWIAATEALAKELKKRTAR